jgi:prepilin-type N-terminal cleavage/methylation domain-containing protein
MAGAKDIYPQSELIYNMKTKKQSGFTLIETVVYLALFGIMFSGAITAAYGILESGGRNNTRAMLQEEGEFMLAKINWAVSNASFAEVSADGNLIGKVYSYDFEFKQSDDDLFFVRNYNSEVLNNSAVRIKNLSFSDISSGANGQEGINYGFDLESNAQNGLILTSSFRSIAYLRK